MQMLYRIEVCDWRTGVPDPCWLTARGWSQCLGAAIFLDSRPDAVSITIIILNDSGPELLMVQISSLLPSFEGIFYSSAFQFKKGLCGYVGPPG